MEHIISELYCYESGCFIIRQKYIQQSLKWQPDLVPIIRVNNTLTLTRIIWHNSCEYHTAYAFFTSKKPDYVNAALRLNCFYN